MLQLPEETCQKYQIEERDSELVVSLDRDQEVEMSFPRTGSPTNTSPPRSDPMMNDQLVHFFTSLENGYQDVNNSTLKLNLNFGDTSFSLYGVPAKDGTGKGEIFLQNQEGMERDAPPMKLTAEQREQLINDIIDLDRLMTSRREDDSRFLDETSDKLNQGQIIQDMLENGEGNPMSQLRRGIGSPSRGWQDKMK